MLQLIDLSDAINFVVTKVIAIHTAKKFFSDHKNCSKSTLSNI